MTPQQGPETHVVHDLAYVEDPHFRYEEEMEGRWRDGGRWRKRGGDLFLGDGMGLRG